MAATLPAINMMGRSGAGQVSSSSIQQHIRPNPPDKLPTQARLQRGFVKGGARQKLSKIEQHLEEKRFTLRGQLPLLSEWETNQYQNSFKHSLCLEILEQGFHKSFDEIFSLIKQQADERIRAGPESTLWNQILLTEEHDKLDTMKKYLVEAEQAQLNADFVHVYHCHHHLAQYFQSTGDKWLVDHFYNNCLSWSKSVKNDDGRAAAEGHCNVGLSLEESGSLQEAANNFQLFYVLTKEKSDWLMADGTTPMHSQSCNNLARIYSSLAEASKSTGDHETCLGYLIKAHEMAEEGGDRKLLGLAGYRLGVAYEKNGDPQTALRYVQYYLESCQSLDDTHGVGQACEAIAKSHKSLGNIEESIKYLRRFIKISEESKNEKALSQACNSLGTTFNSMGEYDQALEYFNRSYNIARTLNEAEVVNLSRVLSGVAHSHTLYANYSRHMEFVSRTCTGRLLDWKDNRNDDMRGPIPLEDVKTSTKQVERIEAPPEADTTETAETESQDLTKTEIHEENEPTEEETEQNEDETEPTPEE